MTLSRGYIQKYIVQVSGERLWPSVYLSHCLQKGSIYPKMFYENRYKQIKLVRILGFSGVTYLLQTLKYFAYFNQKRYPKY